MQVVDPFIPVTKTSQQPSRPLAKLTNNVPRPVKKSATRSSITRAATVKLKQPPAYPSAKHTPSSYTEPSHPKQKSTKHRSKLYLLWTPLLAIAAIILGSVMQSLIAGELLIAGYGLFALLRRVSSRITFTLALMVLVSIVVLLVTKPNNTLAANFATYAFLLLAIGVITLTRELYSEKS